MRQTVTPHPHPHPGPFLSRVIPTCFFYSFHCKVGVTSSSLASAVAKAPKGSYSALGGKQAGAGRSIAILYWTGWRL